MGETMIRILLLLTIIAMVIVFSAQNETTLTISVLHWKFETSLAIVIFFAVLTGVLVMQLLQWKKRPGKGRES